MYKNILFDLGNVFITVQPERALSMLSEFMDTRTAEAIKKEPNEFLKKICNDQELFETGKITMPEFFSRLKNKFGLKMNIEQFENVWCSMFSRKKDVIKFATELSKNYKIFILSNTNETHINHLIDALPIFDFVSGTAFSHEIGYLKPQQDFYFKALKKLNINADESIFIDDLEDNVKAAAEAGITSFKFENLIKLKNDMEKEIKKINILINPGLNIDDNNFIDWQNEVLLDYVNELLLKYPPGIPEPEQRKSALLLLDSIFHDVYAPHRPAVQSFFKTRINKAIDEIVNTEVASGARIWKLYNHAFVVKTKTATIAFDITRAKSVEIDGFSIENKIMEKLIKQCDTLFISHWHDDHADEWIIQSFIDQNKPVVANSGAWNSKPIHPEITHLKRISHTIQTLPVQNGKQELKVVVYPGHQGELENNVYIVTTPDGFSFSQTGDQGTQKDFEWIDEISKHQKIDILMPNCFTEQIARVVKGFNPNVVITGHENELSHTIDHREPYWRTYLRKEVTEKYDVPLVLMTWGESLCYNKEKLL
ncbi:MAG: hypothetical protein DRI44_04945 [Chlamydiae bacterium]|nr:MAG: hypothetical protein DRI44_04945 [Chlamydiota bacterium]